MLYLLNGAPFDYEELDVYRVELAFIAWIADFLGDVAQSWVLVPVLRFPNRSRRRRSRLRPLCISKGWSLRLRSSFHGHATPCDAGRAGVHLPSEPVHDMTIGPADADQAGAHAGRWVHVILSTILRLLPVRLFSAVQNCT